VTDEVDSDGAESSTSSSVAVLSTRRIGVRLAGLLSRPNVAYAAGSSWVAVLNTSTRDVELFSGRLTSQHTVRVHEEGTGAISFDRNDVLWCVGWDSASGRDGCAHCSLRKVEQPSESQADVVSRLGRHRRATALDVNHGVALVGYEGGEVVLTRVNQPNGGQQKVCTATLSIRADENAPPSPCEVTKVVILDAATAAVATRLAIFIVRLSGDDTLIFEEADNTGIDSTNACCAAVGELVVARADAISFYNQYGRGRCLAMAAPNAMVASSGPYVFVLSHGPKGRELIGYDVDAQLIAHRIENPPPVVGILGVRKGRVLTVFADGVVTALTELPPKHRVEELLQRSQFVAALTVVKRDGDPALLESTVHVYSRNLVARGDFNAAAEQLANIASESSDTSSVITLLMEQRGTRNALRKYLEALLSKGLARVKHIRLLVSCYNDDLSSEADGTSEMPISVKNFAKVMEGVSDESAAQVAAACRDANLFDAAESLARERKMYLLLARILAEDKSDTDGVLDLLPTIPRQTALEIIFEIGRVLRNANPDRFLSEIISVAFRADEKLREEEAAETAQTIGESILQDNPELHAKLLEMVLSRTPQGGKPPPYVQRIMERLFEILVVIDVTSAENSNRAKPFLISARLKTDRERMCHIAELHSHLPCLRILREETRAYDVLAHQLCVEGDVASLHTACKRHGDREPDMWLQLIRLIAMTPHGSTGDITLEEAVDAALKTKTVSEAEVVDLICKVAPKERFLRIRDHFRRAISQLAHARDFDVAAAEKAQAELEQIAADTKNLKTGPIIVQLGICQACDAMTILPAVYFLCGHSYHARCLASKECPACSHATRSVTELNHALAQEGSQHDVFFKELERDGYEAVLRYLERSALR